MLVLAIGGSFIPTRACKLPPQFIKLLKRSLASSNGIEHVICLGNMNASVATLKFLKDISSNLHLVKGEEDDIGILTQQLLELKGEETVIPLYNVISVDKLKIGFTLGIQTAPKNDPLVLLTIARDLDVDILLWGGLHKIEAYTMDGKFFVNPGSASGAFTFELPEYELDDEKTSKTQDSNSIDEKPPHATDEASTTDDVSHSELGGSNEKNDLEDHLKNNSLLNNTGDSLDDTKTPKRPNVVASTSKEDPEPNVVEYEESLDFERIYADTENVPSFCILDVQGTTCDLYIYTCLEGNVKVDKVVYQK